MSKSKDFRELQVSSGQLAAVIISLLVLCVFIFFLGTRVGAKKSLLATARTPPGSKTVNIITPKPVQPDPAVISPLPSEGSVGATKVAAEEMIPSTSPGLKTKPPVDSKIAPPGAKTESVAIDPKTKPAALKTETPPLIANPAAEKPKDKDGRVNLPPAKKPATTSSGVFFVQVAAVDTRPAAEAFAKKIEAQGYPVRILEPLNEDKKTVYRVRIGPYETKTDAEDAWTKIAADLKKKKTDFFIVKG